MKTLKIEIAMPAANPSRPVRVMKCMVLAVKDHPPKYRHGEDLVRNSPKDVRVLMTSVDDVRPFPPSWVDRFTDWLEGLPGPAWTAYVGFYLFLVLQSHLVNWAYERVPWFVFEQQQFVYQLFSAEVLFFLGYLNRDAARALEDFKPLTNISEAELDQIKYRLSHQPARPVLVLSLLGLVLGVLSFYSAEQFLGADVTFNFYFLFSALSFILPTALALVFCYRIIIQLQTVSRLYATATELDLFNLEPVYALSSHTAKTGLIFLFLIYSNLLLSPGSIMVPTSLVLTIAISILSFAGFVLPLRGINHRLVAEKKKLLCRVNTRIRRVFDRLERIFDEGELSEMPEMEKTILNLQHQKAYIEKIPTWPWQPTTMRGFISAMLLPIVIWVVQQVLERFLDF